MLGNACHESPGRNRATHLATVTGHIVELDHWRFSGERRTINMSYRASHPQHETYPLLQHTNCQAEDQE
jgi:hypothetical protein